LYLNEASISPYTPPVPEAADPIADTADPAAETANPVAEVVEPQGKEDKLSKVETGSPSAADPNILTA
jgi:hypothetical protein